MSKDAVLPSPRKVTPRVRAGELGGPGRGPSAAFTYGSLMSPEIMARVSGVPAASLVAQPAWLAGFARHPVRGEEYPGIVPDAGAPTLCGVLYTDLPEMVWQRLDAFEGSEYERISVDVQLSPAPEGATRTAWVYRFKDSLRDRLLPGDWDAEAFAHRGKARFEAQYLGFERID